MAHPSESRPNPTPLVAALLRFARVRGVLATDVATRFGVRDRELEAIVTAKTLRRLFEVVANLTGEPHLGLRLASEEPLGVAEDTLGSSATVSDALRAFGRRPESVHPEVSLQLVTEEAGDRWVQRTPPGPPGIGSHAEEYALAVVIARCRHACSADPIRATSVWLRSARPRDVGPLQRFFGSDAIAFGCPDSGFTISKAALDARLAVRVQPLLEATSMSAAVRATLPKLLADGATLEATARALAVSARTLQRRLEDEGSRFVDVLESVRETTARTLLLDPAVSLAEVAERLGFSDLATFSRAFKRWTGMPPGTFRRTR